jgi:DNA polymerase III alpha subunit (gram-positive type)
MIDRGFINRVMLKYAGIGKTKYLVEDPKQVFDKLKNEVIIFFDTETTGLYASVYQITSIAAVAVKGENFSPIDTFNKKIKLTGATKARMQCEKMLELQGTKSKKDHDKNIEQCLLDQRYSPDDPSLGEGDSVLRDFKKFCDKHNAVMIGQNATFDMEQVNVNLKKINEQPIKHKGVYDTMLFMKFYVVPALQALVKRAGTLGIQAQGMLENMKHEKVTGGKGNVSYNLESILKAFGLNITGWHGAFDDVQSTLTAFRLMSEFFSKFNDLSTDPAYIEHQEKAFSNVAKEKRPESWKSKTRERFYEKERERGKRIQDITPENLPY